MFDSIPASDQQKDDEPTGEPKSGDPRPVLGRLTEWSTWIPREWICNDHGQPATEHLV